MSNGLLDAAEFENQIDEMGDDQLKLIKFVARQQFTSSKVIEGHSKRLHKLESRDRKQFGVSGGIGGIIGSAIAVLIYFFKGW